MPLFDALPTDKKRTVPLLWFRRLALFRDLDPATLIRNVPLHTGMNIVWGIESDDAEQSFTPGHGVGKTTFCRLLRYCLGEQRFGQEHLCHEVRSTFPDGCVAAEIMLDGELWCVLRPFNQHRPSYACQGATIEELLADRGAPHSYNEFREQLTATCMRDIPAQGALTTGGDIRWDHILAMCARDQEARYQSLWQWRTSRSDSGTPAFQHPRNDALICVRAILGLLAAEETALRRELREAETLAAQLERDIQERQREPEYWVRQLRRRLKEEYGIADAEAAQLDSTDLYGLPNLVKNAASQLDITAARLSDELDQLERQISIASAALQEPAELHEQINAAAETTDAGTATLLDDLREVEALRQMIHDAELAFCKYGRVSIGECSYAQGALAGCDDQLRQARQETVPVTARREQVGAALQEQRDRLANTMRRLQEQLNGLLERRRQLDDDRRRATNDARGLRRAFLQLQNWEEMRAGRIEDSELSRLVGQRAGAVTTAETTRSNLERVLQEQDSRAQHVRDIFDSLVKKTLSADFKGIVQVGRDDLVFRIVRGESMSGEAFETLAILLSDLAALLLGSLDLAQHPDLLIHDSPREADLGPKIYRSFFQSISAAETELAGSECPFQYIVTTTTDPPAELQAEPKTAMRLGGHHGLLFGQQLLTEPIDPQQSLLPKEDDS